MIAHVIKSYTQDTLDTQWVDTTSHGGPNTGLRVPMPWDILEALNIQEVE